MQLPTRLSRFIAKRGVAATAAAVMMVGGGVAIAQTGGGDAEEPPGHEVARNAIGESAAFDIDAFCEEHAPEASFCAGHSPGHSTRDEDVDTDTDTDTTDVVALDDEAENAEAFSEWVRSIPSEWGCIRGQLVSAAAQAGPLTSDFEDFLDELGGSDGYADDEMFETPKAAADYLELDGRCVEVALEREGQEDNGDNGNGDEQGEINTAENSNGGPPEGASPPAHAGPPERDSATQGAGPPEGKGPPGRSGN